MLRKTRAVLLPSRAAAAAERRSQLPILFLERCDFPAGRDFSKENLLHVSYYQQLTMINVGAGEQGGTLVAGGFACGMIQLFDLPQATGGHKSVFIMTHVPRARSNDYDSSLTSQALAKSQSRRTVRGDILRTSTISSS